MTTRLSEAGRWLLPGLAVLFFFSGASALIYQVLWLRLLGLVFGVTVYAASTVWASFMAGLALGSFCAGRLADRVGRPLLWFGVVELGIALSAAATPFVQDVLTGVYASRSAVRSGDLVARTFLRFGISFALLIVPTLLMGATLPLVVRSSVFRMEELGARTGVLYASNTAGAIAGTLAAGLYLIPNWGMAGAFRMAGLLNLVVGAVAIGAAGLCRMPREFGAAQAAPPVSGTVVEILPEGTRRLVLAVFVVSGAIALALEMIWLRLIVLFVRPTVYAFAMMLASVLAGIAVGSYVVAPQLRRGRRWLFSLALLEGAIAIAGLLSIAVLPLFPAAVRTTAGLLGLLAPPYLAPVITSSALVALPTALLMGVAFPIGLALWANSGNRERSSTATRVGLFYALNVCGGIAGSLLAGFLLLPRLGSRASLILVCSVALASSLALIASCPTRPRGRATWAAGLLAAFVGLAWMLPEPFDVFLKQRYPRERVLWREEGIQSTVSVHELPDGRRAMYLEGSHQASNSGGMAFVHHRIGTLPMAIHANPRDALVIGLGGGATAGAVSRHPGVRVDIVELSPSVIRASDFFRDINFDVVRRPNVHLRVDDGRNYLMLTRWRYDVIAADIILPIHAGAGNLYSAEYFRLVRNALNEDGVALQWFSGTDAEYKLVARTFLSVFPHTTVWADGTLLLGAKKPLQLRRSDFEWKTQIPERREAFRSIGVQNFEDLVQMFLAGPEELRRFVGEGPLLTDDRPVVEYFLSLPRDRDVDLSGLRGDVRPYLAH